MGRREGLGDVLADGTALAAARIGNGSERFAIHFGGQEPPAHDPRYGPSWGLIYAADATPGRHTQFAAYVLETGGVIPGLDVPKVEKHAYTGKGAVNAKINNVGQALYSAGICMFATARVDMHHWAGMIEAVSGVPTSVDDLDRHGARIAAMRHAFSLREGANPLDYHLPDRAFGRPALQSGPHANITVDVETMRREFYVARGWDPDSGIPSEQVLRDLGLDDVARDLHGGAVAAR